MRTSATISHDENQRALGIALESLRRRLAAVAEPDQSAIGYAALDPSAIADAAPVPSLDTLCSLFGLGRFERELLLLCAGVELDAAIADLCARIHRDAAAMQPTFSLALAALDEPHWSALLPDAPLRRWRLIEVSPSASLTRAALRVDERILHYLVGLDAPDARLAGIAARVTQTAGPVVSHRRHAESLASSWRAAEPGALPVVVLRGGDPLALQSIAAEACSLVGLELWRMRAGAIPTGVAELEATLRLWEREAVLGARALYLTDDGAAQHDVIARVVEAARGVVVVASDRRIDAAGRPTLTIDIDRIGADEQTALWSASLPSHLVDGWVPELVAQFDFGSDAIRAVARNVTAAAPESLIASASESSGLRERVWSACRSRTRGSLEELAQRIDPRATWDDLVLPPARMAMLHEIAAQVRGRATVYERWGFARRLSRGLGISALFAGTSGTGKTMAAEVLAADLQLDLYRIDLSQVVSKYIGETEKNLRRVFDAAEEGGAILLFDEADALFGKRSEVKDSHDRYANIEVGYLLQRMEAYRGLAILTTNMRSALDTAFLRRLRFVVEFPFPDVAQREEIWRRVMPAATPTEGLDVAQLARLTVPGGNIINIALNGAFLAAEAGEPVRMGHLLRAARSEYAKLEKPLTEAEIGGWL